MSRKLINPGSLVVDIHQTTLHSKVEYKDNYVDYLDPDGAFITFNPDEPMIVIASIDFDDPVAKYIYMFVTIYGVGWDWDSGSLKVLE